MAYHSDSLKYSVPLIIRRQRKVLSVTLGFLLFTAVLSACSRKASVSTFPATMDEAESAPGVWVFSGQQGAAWWRNGAVAQLKLERFDGDDVVITRTDIAGPSVGLTARYEGKLQNGRIDGSAQWSWPERWGSSTPTGSWQAVIESVSADEAWNRAVKKNADGDSIETRRWAFEAARQGDLRGVEALPVTYYEATTEGELLLWQELASSVAISAKTNQPAKTVTVPATMESCIPGKDKDICGNWMFDGTQGSGLWTHGETPTEEAQLEIGQFDSDHIVITQTDNFGSSVGLTARYEGTLRNDHVEGSVIVNSPDGRPLMLPWHATIDTVDINEALKRADAAAGRDDIGEMSRWLFEAAAQGSVEGKDDLAAAEKKLGDEANQQAQMRMLGDIEGLASAFKDDDTQEKYDEALHNDCAMHGESYAAGMCWAP